jgi:hypothetical protein
MSRRIVRRRACRISYERSRIFQFTPEPGDVNTSRGTVLMFMALGPLTLPLSQREGAPLNWRPSAVTDAGNGRPLSYSLRSPSADAVAGGGDRKTAG